MRTGKAFLISSVTYISYYLSYLTILELDLGPSVEAAALCAQELLWAGPAGAPCLAACRPSCTASSLAASRAVLASNHVLDCAIRSTRARAAASQRGSTERSAAPYCSGTTKK